MNSMKRQKDMTLKNELPRSVVTQYATGEEQRNSSRRSKEAEPKWKQGLVLDVSSSQSEVQCCKDQYFLRTWNVRSVNQGKFDMVKQYITGGSDGKGSAYNTGRPRFNPWVGKTSWRREYLPTLVFFSG